MELDFSTRDTEIYLDNAATTVVADEVVGAMIPYLEERYGNPETPYGLGREANDAVDVAREQIAEMLGCLPGEVFFTSGGTESNNWAIKGFQYSKNLSDPYGLVVSSIEHDSVLSPSEWICNHEVCSSLGRVPVDQDGIIDLGELEVYIKSGGCGLVSVQHGNNEVGTLQPIEEVASLCKQYGAALHCDACQSFGKVAIDVDELGVDMMSISAHKIHGPMGVGALYVRSGTSLEPLHHGGGHQDGMRSGTLPVANIVGFGKAAEMAWGSVKREMPRLFTLTEALAQDLETTCGAVRNGHRQNRLPHILSVTFPKTEAAMMVGLLAKEGICVSTGAACSQGKSGSGTLIAMGKGKSECTSTLRISLSRYNTSTDMMALTSRIQAALVGAEKREAI